MMAEVSTQMSVSAVIRAYKTAIDIYDELVSQQGINDKVKAKCEPLIKLFDFHIVVIISDLCLEMNRTGICDVFLIYLMI